MNYYFIVLIFNCLDEKKTYPLSYHRLSKPTYHYQIANYLFFSPSLSLFIPWVHNKHLLPLSYLIFPIQFIHTIHKTN